MTCILRCFFIRVININIGYISDVALLYCMHKAPIIGTNSQTTKAVTPAGIRTRTQTHTHIRTHMQVLKYASRLNRLPQRNFTGVKNQLDTL